METSELTRAERWFRLWMRISFWTYVFGAAFFLFAGAHIPAVINAVSPRFLPPYPLPESAPEGAFWRVLAVSMMLMLSWACRAIYRDVRGNGWLVSIILLSKICSTVVYCVLFLAHHHLAYLVGALTDGPIFVATGALWFAASAADRYFNPKEEAILAALGDALMPRGGAFLTGYLDVQEACLADVRRLLASQYPVMQVYARLFLRLLNVMPMFVDFRPCTLLSMPHEQRAGFLMRAENHRIADVRSLVLLAKLLVVFPYFNQPDAYRAVGYVPEARIQP